MEVAFGASASFNTIAIEEVEQDPDPLPEDEFLQIPQIYESESYPESLEYLDVSEDTHEDVPIAPIESAPIQESVMPTLPSEISLVVAPEVAAPQTENRVIEEAVDRILVMQPETREESTPSIIEAPTVEPRVEVAAPIIIEHIAPPLEIVPKSVKGEEQNVAQEASTAEAEVVTEEKKSPVVAHDTGADTEEPKQDESPVQFSEKTASQEPKKDTPVVDVKPSLPVVEVARQDAVNAAVSIEQVAQDVPEQVPSASIVINSQEETPVHSVIEVAPAIDESPVIVQEVLVYVERQIQAATTVPEYARTPEVVTISQQAVAPAVREYVYETLPAPARETIRARAQGLAVLSTLLEGIHELQQARIKVRSINISGKTLESSLDHSNDDDRDAYDAMRKVRAKIATLQNLAETLRVQLGRQAIAALKSPKYTFAR